MNRHERLNEDQFFFFGFSPMALGDELFNAIVDSWERQVDALMKTPQWSKVKEAKKARAALINLMFEKGNDDALIGMCDQISEYAHLNVFKIPNHVVLPGTEPLQQMESADPAALRRRVAKAEKRVAEAKKRAALLTHEKKDVLERLKVIRDVARKLGYESKEEVTGETGDATMRTNVTTTMEDESMTEESVFEDDNKENDENDRGDEKMEETTKEIDDDSLPENKTMTGEEDVEEMMERSMTLED